MNLFAILVASCIALLFLTWYVQNRLVRCIFALVTCVVVAMTGFKIGHQLGKNSERGRVLRFLPTLFVDLKNLNDSDLRLVIDQLALRIESEPGRIIEILENEQEKMSAHSE